MYLPSARCSGFGRFADDSNRYLIGDEKHLVPIGNQLLEFSRNIWVQYTPVAWMRRKYLARLGGYDGPINVKGCNLNINMATVATLLNHHTF